MMTEAQEFTFLQLRARSRREQAKKAGRTCFCSIGTVCAGCRALIAAGEIVQEGSPTDEKA